MRLILVRHGNTFGPGDKVTWVGSSNDLALVEEGERQAQRVGQLLKSFSLGAIFYAPLKRTRRFAEIIASETGSDAPLLEDDRLTELDYGDWSGRSDVEVSERFGADSLKQWVDKSVWPVDGNWGSTEGAIISEVADFVSEVCKKYSGEQNIVVVSSNGRLRYFLKLVENEFEKRIANSSFKVGTGKVCVLEARDLQSDKPSCILNAWNEAPEGLAAALV